MVTGQPETIMERAERRWVYRIIQRHPNFFAEIEDPSGDLQRVRSDSEAEARHELMLARKNQNQFSEATTLAYREWLKRNKERQ